MNDSIVQVAILSPPYAVLSYTLPEYFPAACFFAGQRLAVPMGKGLRIGVLDAFAGDKAQEGTGGFTLKSALWPLDRHPLISPAYMDLARQLALRQTEGLGRILAGLLPAGLRVVGMRVRFFGPGKPREMALKALSRLPPEDLRACAELWRQGRAELVRAGLSALDAEQCLLAADPPWPVRPVATAQTALLEYLLEHGPVTRRKLMEALGSGATAALSTLVGRGLVHIRPLEEAEGPEEPYGLGGPEEGAGRKGPKAPKAQGLPFASPSLASPSLASPPGASFVSASSPEEAPSPSSSSSGAESEKPFILTEPQRAALDDLCAALRSGRAESRLLFGITGSGKTAVYLELAREALALGRSVLLLAPEVALALKLWGDAKAAFAAELPKERLLLYHGYQGQAARERIFTRLAREGARSGPLLVVGTRSALLLPLEDIGLVILDEEHDASFKQDEGYAYQAKEVAWYRAQRGRALLLLGSATPDIKSYYAARQGLIPLHELRERVGGGSLPEVELVRLDGRAAGGALLAPGSAEALLETVARGDQAVILLNRRGYAPIMYCLSCNETAKCPHCDISLAYHKGRERLLCHYCGFSAPYPCPCTACGGMHFLPMGQGTEKLEEELGPMLPPGSVVLRLDRDSARRAGRMEEILASFARKEAQVLVGTQMLSKGHHFPDVTLAIVADADLGLNLPDYRAAERTFQLLLQSAGRAGRGGKAGRVLIQTRDPAHYCWDFVKRADYEGFYERELALRKRRLYPPFVRLALIRISHARDFAPGADSVQALGRALRPLARELGVTMLGPAPAPLPCIKGRRRWHCLLKAPDWPPLRALFTQAQKLAAKQPLRLALDLDPVNML